MATKATVAATETPKSLESDVKQLRSDIDKLVAQLNKTGQQSYGTARKAAAVGVDQIKSHAQDLETQVVEHVREKPITSLAIAAGIGYLFALISSR